MSKTKSNPHPVPDPDALRRLLAARLEALGWCVYRLAVASGKVNDQRSIALFLAGETSPTIDTVMRWLAAAGGSVSVAWGELERRA